MNAIFQRNGFTMMKDLGTLTPPEFFVVPEMSPLDFNKPFDTDITSSLTNWTFRLKGIQYVDGERVAFYEYNS